MNGMRCLICCLSHAVLRFLVYLGFVVFAGFPWTTSITWVQVYIGALTGLIFLCPILIFIRQRWTQVAVAVLLSGLLGIAYILSREVGESIPPATRATGMFISSVLWGVPGAFAVWLAGIVPPAPLKLSARSRG